MRRARPSPAAPGWPRPDLDLPAYPVAAGRVQLPSPADLLALWRRSHRALRVVGRRLDDPGAVAALPALGNLRDRQRTPGRASPSPVVPALALRALAWRQCAVERDEFEPHSSHEGGALPLPHCGGGSGWGLLSACRIVERAPTRRYAPASPASGRGAASPSARPVPVITPQLRTGMLQRFHARRAMLPCRNR